MHLSYQSGFPSCRTVVAKFDCILSPKHRCEDGRGWWVRRWPIFLRSKDETRDGGKGHREEKESFCHATWPGREIGSSSSPPFNSPGSSFSPAVSSCSFSTSTSSSLQVPPSRSPGGIKWAQMSMSEGSAQWACPGYCGRHQVTDNFSEQDLVFQSLKPENVQDQLIQLPSAHCS